MTHTRRTWLLAASAAACGLGSVPAAATAALRLGLAPFLSPAALLNAFRPLREQLATALGQPVQAFTARDFRAMVTAMRDGDYDMALVPAHLARIAVTDWQWVPLAATVQATDVLLLARDGGPVRTPQALAGGRVGMLDPLSLTAARGTAWLTERAIKVDVEPQPSINSALVALSRGHLDAVVAAESQLRGLPPGTPADQTVLARMNTIPGPAVIGRPALPATLQAQWRAALAAFQPDPSRPVTAANTRLTPLTPELLAPLGAEAELLRRQLGLR